MSSDPLPDVGIDSECLSDVLQGIIYPSGNGRQTGNRLGIDMELQLVDVGSQ